VKINNLLAFYALEVLMFLQAPVKALHVTRSLYYACGPDAGQRQQRSVNRIQRDTGDGFSDSAVQYLGRGMLTGFDQRLVNRHPLRGNL
jgi:hypothetical protein